MELFTAPVGEVGVGGERDVKIESRVNRLEQWERLLATATGGYGEAGLVVSAGLPGVAVGGARGMVGGGSTTVRTASRQTGFGDYKYTRPDGAAWEITAPLCGRRG